VCLPFFHGWLEIKNPNTAAGLAVRTLVKSHLQAVAHYQEKKLALLGRPEFDSKSNNLGCSELAPKVVK
jgi:hypothetical protein